MKGIFFASLLFILILVNSCTEGEVYEQYIADDYYPVEIGNYWIYKIDSTTYSTIGTKIESTTSYSKEEIINRHETPDGVTYTIEHSFSDLQNGDWKYVDTWSTSIEGNRIIKNEENLPFIKLVEPVIIGESYSWNHNLLLFEDDLLITVAGETIDLFRHWKSTYTDHEEQVAIENTEYHDVLDVNLVDFEDILEKRYVKEQYAKNVGLIYAQHKIFDTQCIECTSSWLEKAEKGYSLEKKLVSYGHY